MLYIRMKKYVKKEWSTCVGSATYSILALLKLRKEDFHLCTVCDFSNPELKHRRKTIICNIYIMHNYVWRFLKYIINGSWIFNGQHFLVPVNCQLWKLIVDKILNVVVKVYCTKCKWLYFQTWKIHERNEYIAYSTEPNKLAYSTHHNVP